MPNSAVFVPVVYEVFADAFTPVDEFATLMPMEAFESLTISNFLAGLAVPIPTFCAVSIVIAVVGVEPV